jgi:hypothetical protein
LKREAMEKVSGRNYQRTNTRNNPRAMKIFLKGLDGKESKIQYNAGKIHTAGYIST